MAFSTSYGGNIFFEAAKILYLSYRASLILVNSDAWGAFLECTLLPGALVTYYRDWIISLLVSI